MNDLPVLLAQDVPESPLMPEPSATIPISNVPQIVIENLPPTSSGLSQPWATVIAGLLAIAAATIAYFGIRHQAKQHIRATKALLRQQGTAMIRQEKQAQRAIDAQRGLHDDAQRRQQRQHDQSLRAQRKVIEIEIGSAERKQNQSDRLDALMDASAGLNDALNACLTVAAFEPGEADDDDLRELARCLDRCYLIELKLHLIGATRASASIRDAIAIYRRLFTYDQPSRKQIVDGYESTRESFRTEFESPELPSESRLMIDES
ncbi:hypothetical protein [Rhodococcus sp. KB6]|uniref:hypothetical protein n=1 Tax=Rhodococcus sp. KB6 TaxID=1752066 RepID=UPI000717E9C0|nr:hypothetical protein [Rhodococcus sp. KB6]